MPPDFEFRLQQITTSPTMQVHKWLTTSLPNDTSCLFSFWKTQFSATSTADTFNHCHCWPTWKVRFPIFNSEIFFLLDALILLSLLACCARCIMACGTLSSLYLIAHRQVLAVGHSWWPCKLRFLCTFQPYLNSPATRSYTIN